MERRGVKLVGENDNPADIQTELLNLAKALDWVIKSIKSNVTSSAKAIPSEMHLLEIHRIAAESIVSDSGAYRQSEVVVSNLTPPPHTEVPTEMSKFFSELQYYWEKCDPISLTAFVLWKINLIHPFENGNGRTARLFSYMVFNHKTGVLMHGRGSDIYPRILGTVRRSELVECLNYADNGNLGSLKDLVADVIKNQLVRSYS